MLKSRSGSDALELANPALPAPAGEASDIARLLSTIHLHWPIIALATVACLAVGMVYLLVTPPTFTASSLIIIDNRAPNVLREDSVYQETNYDATAVESQVEVLRSESVLSAVVTDLELDSNTAFLGSASTGVVAQLFSALGGLFGGANDDSVLTKEALERKAIDILKDNVSIGRVGRTLVLQVSYRSTDPHLAARIANAIPDAYITEQLSAKFQATRRATTWLEDRLRELSTQVRAADISVEQYKAENRIVDTGRGLLDEQQLGEIVSQLVSARASTAEAKARLDRISAVRLSGVPDAAVTDVLGSAVITRFRQQYLEAAKQEANWSGRYGHEHEAVLKLRGEMSELQKAMQSELGRIAETYKSDYDIARAREQSLEASVQGAVRQTTSTNAAQVDLRGLQSTSQSYRTLYDTFLARFMQTTQQQSLPITEARVITGAAVPRVKSAPRASIVLGVAAVLGLGLGVGGAFAREALDRVLRTSGDVEQTLGVECLGILPIFGNADASEAKPAVPATPRIGEAASERLLSGDIDTHRQVIVDPFSRFCETLRSVKVGIDVANLVSETRIIGVTSALPREGKTTISNNLAELLAHTGHKTLLVDCDLRNPATTREMVPGAKRGLIELLQGHVSFEEALWRDPLTGLEVLPAPLQHRIFHTAEVVASASMARFLESVRTKYQYVILDLPPIAPVVDVRAMAHLIDAFLLVVEWGQTHRRAVTEAAFSSETLYSRILGVVLNQADPSVLRRVEIYKGKYYGGYYGEKYVAGKEQTL
jgi:succinoglycan biosynthesis transport protein ExoP